MIANEEVSVQLHAEELSVSKREAVTGTVRVLVQTHTRDQLVDENLETERVEIERIPVGRIVDSVPAIREVGDTTIIPVVEEVLVTEKRLLLKEEIHMRRVRTRERHVETFTLREQQATVERDEPSFTHSVQPTVS